MNKKLQNKFLTFTKALGIGALMCLGSKANAQCIADFTGYDMGYSGKATFSGIPSPTATYQWSFGDGGTSTDMGSTAHTYALNGTYNVCLTVTDTAAHCTNTYCDYVAIYSANYNQGSNCDATFWGYDDGYIGEAQFYALQVSETAMYTWDFGDTTTESNYGVEYATHTYSHNGTFPVCLTVNDTAAQCTTTYCDYIYTYSANKVANCDATFYGYDGWDGNMYFYSQYYSPNPTATYSWDFGDGSSSSDIEPIHSYAQNGQYNVCLTISDTAASCTNTFCSYVTMYSIGYTPGTGSCDAFFYGEDEGYYGAADFTNWTYLDPNSIGHQISYTWDFGDGTTLVDSTGWSYGYTSHTYAQNGTYNVCLTVSDTAASCTNTFCSLISIFSVGTGYNDCDATFYGYDDGMGAVDFWTDAYWYNPSPTATYLWTFGDGTTSTDKSETVSHTYTSNGQYPVCLTIEDAANNCSNTYCDYVYVNSVGCNLSAEFTIVHDTVNKYNYTVYNASSSGASYFWNFGDNTYSTEQYPTHTYTGVGPYELCLAVMDSSSTCYSYHCDSILDAGRSVVSVEVLPATSNGVKENINSIQKLENYPNPFSNSTTIAYTIRQNATIELSIIDLLGNKVAIVESGSKSSGSYKTEWNAQNVAPGIYMLQLRVNGQVSTRKLVVNK